MASKATASEGRICGPSVILQQGSEKQKTEEANISPVMPSCVRQKDQGVNKHMHSRQVRHWKASEDLWEPGPKNEGLGVRRGLRKIPKVGGSPPPWALLHSLARPGSPYPLHHPPAPCRVFSPEAWYLSSLRPLRPHGANAETLR